jgi:hypothetical protein
MYLSQAVSLLAPLRVKSDLFLCLHLGQEVHLESAVATLVPTFRIPAGRRIGAGCDLFRVGSLGTPLHLSSEVHLGCRNPAHLEVRPYAIY